MKKRGASKNGSKIRFESGRIYLRIPEPGKKLIELVSVYEDLERTLKKLKTKPLLHGDNSLMQINIQKLITQLSKSKRNIEKKISHTVLTERIQIQHQINKWAPKISSRLSRTGKKTRVKTEKRIN